MREQTIKWYKFDEKEPPDLIPVIFNVYIKFNAKHAFRYGYYNKYANMYWIEGAHDQYKTYDNFVERKNKHFNIAEWAEIRNYEQKETNEARPCGG